MEYLFVAIFGALGAVTKYMFVTGLFNHQSVVVTLFANLLGTMVLGIIIGFFKEFNIDNFIKPLHLKEVWVGIRTGFLGAFTTYSTFSVEVSRALESGDCFLVLGYVISSLVGGIIVAFVAMKFGERLGLKWKES